MLRSSDFDTDAYSAHVFHINYKMTNINSAEKFYKKYMNTRNGMNINNAKSSNRKTSNVFYV